MIQLMKFQNKDSNNAISRSNIGYCNYITSLWFMVILPDIKSINASKRMLVHLDGLIMDNINEKVYIYDTNTKD